MLVNQQEWLAREKSFEQCKLVFLTVSMGKLIYRHSVTNYVRQIYDKNIIIPLTQSDRIQTYNYNLLLRLEIDLKMSNFSITYLRF